MGPLYDKLPLPAAEVRLISLAQLPMTRILVSVLGVLLAMLMAVLDQTIVATALPRVVADLGGFDQFQWIFTAYMLVTTTSIPIMGKLSDMYGRKRVLVAGVGIFVLGSGLAAGAQDMIQLIVFRGVQGLGAGSIIANSYAVFGDVMPPAQRGKWMGIVGGVFALAIVAGPLVGGFLTDHLSWRWIFLVNLPLGIVAISVIMLGMADVRLPRVKSGIDYRGVITLIACVVPLLLALTWAGNELPWASPQIIGLLSFSGLMAALLVLTERNVKEPIIPGFLFANPIFTVTVLATFLTAILMFGGIMFIPLFVQGVIGSSATNAGIALMPVMLSGVVAAVIAGQIISRTGHYYAIAVIGVSAMAGGAYLFSRLGADSSTTDAIRYMVVAGAGLGLTLPTFMICVQNAFPHHSLGVVTASVQFSRNIGGAVGTALLGSYLTIRLGEWIPVSASQDELDSLPPQVADELTNPNTLMDPGAMSRIRELAEAEGSGAAFQVVEQGLRSALAAAMHDVFILAMGIGLAAVVVTLFLREIPLRNTMTEATGEMDPGSPD